MRALFLFSLIFFISISAFSQSLFWQKASTSESINADPGNGYFIVNSKPSLLRLPLTPIDGDTVCFIDITGTFSQNPLTVDPGNFPIDGYPGAKIFNITDIFVTIVFSGSDSTWKIVSASDRNIVSKETAGIVITPLAFNAIGDGIADDYKALTRFFNFVTTYGVKAAFEKTKTYYTSRRLEVIIEKDFFIDFRNSTIIMDYSDFTENWQEIIYFGQKPAFTKKLIDDIPGKGNFKIKVDSYAGIKPGMGVRLVGDYYNGTGSGTFNKAMLNSVADTLENGWVLLTDPIPYDFKKDGFGTKSSLSFFNVFNIEIKNLNVDLTGFTGDLKYDVYNVEMENLFSAKIRNITIKKPLRFGLRGRSFYNCILDSITIDYSSDQSKSIYGFGTELFVNTVIKNSSFSSYSVSVTSSKFPSYGLTWDNCTFSSFSSLGYDSHGDLDIKITNSKLYGARFVFGKFTVVKCDILSNSSNDYIIQVVKSPLDISITNCNFYNCKGKYLVKEENIGEFNSDNSLVFAHNNFYSSDVNFSFLPNVIYKDNRMITNRNSFMLPNTPDRNSIRENFYSDFTKGHISSTYDLDGISAITGLVKAKFNDAESVHCFLSEESGNIFFWRFRENNVIELRFKNSEGENPTLKFTNVNIMDTLWHTYAFTLANDTARLYIDGLHAQTISTKFSAMQSYPRLVNIGQRSIYDGVDNISCVLIFEKSLSPDLIAAYSANPSNGKYKARIALLDRKTESVWLDDSGNGNNGKIGEGILLK